MSNANNLLHHKTPDAHPSRRRDGSMAIARVSDGLVFLRQPPDAWALVDSGAFRMVPAETPSIRDILETKRDGELVSMMAATGAGNRRDPREYMVEYLTKQVENGAVSLGAE